MQVVAAELMYETEHYMVRGDLNIHSFVSHRQRGLNWRLLCTQEEVKKRGKALQAQEEEHEDQTIQSPETDKQTNTIMQ